MNDGEWSAILWHDMVLRCLFTMIAILIGPKATARVSDWLVKRSAQRLSAKYAEDCERQWLADFYELPPWLRLKSSTSVFFSREILKGRSRSERMRTAAKHPSTTIVMQANRSDLAAVEPSAGYDRLTGMDNRRAFENRLYRVTAPFWPMQRGLSVIIVNMDRFTFINQQLGHLGGDAILREIGRRLKGCLRRRDHICRFGGDEFAIVLPNTSLVDAQHMAERCRLTCDLSLVSADVGAFRLSASIGLAPLIDGMRAEAMLERAASALNSAKSHGRNCVQIFDDR